jgi:phage terminase small subunit
MKLSERQKRFVDFYLESGNATEAAIKAGYSKKTARKIASENLTKPDVSAYLNERLEQIESQRIAKPTEVLEYLTAVLRRESRSEIALVVGQGKGVSNVQYVEKSPDEKERLKAAELLGKRYALFTDKISVDGVVPVVFSGENDLE